MKIASCFIPELFISFHFPLSNHLPDTQKVADEQYAANVVYF